jgi:hypothetical protein
MQHNAEAAAQAAAGEASATKPKAKRAPAKK